MTDRYERTRDPAEGEGRAVTAVRVTLFGRECFLPAYIAQEVEQACAAHDLADGEEIMVNTPYDVFILPLRPSGLNGNAPRFVVHVPGPEQPAAPSGEAVGDWVLVPRTPTDAMLRAAQSAWLNDPQRRTTTMWSAMLYAAPQQPAAVVDEAAVWRVIAELRAYNPAADEHKGAHIHKVWAKELAAALATNRQEVPRG